MIRGLEQLSCEDSLRQPELFSLEKGRFWDDLRAPFQYLNGGYRSAGDGPFTRACSKQTKGNGIKLKEDKFRSDFRKKFFSIRVVGTLEKSPREVVDIPSMEMFKASVDLMSEVEIGSRLGHSDHKAIKFKISVDRRKSASKTSTLYRKREHFSLLRELIPTNLWGLMVFIQEFSKSWLITITKPLSMISKQSRESGKVPADWKMASVVPVFKKVITVYNVKSGGPHAAEANIWIKLKSKIWMEIMESSDRDMYRQFQDWCLRTYGDSGKTKTVTRKKYDRIVQLLNGSESSSTDNAKFKFWVKSKGFQLGNSDEVSGGAGGGKQVLYVPVKTTDGVGVDEKLSLRRVAVVEDFFDIIYSMHVETGPNGEQIRKHAGQKRTYKAISETYAFLPREAVTRFLMSCSECQKRMHLNPDGADHKDNGKPPTLVTSMIDYNMPITMAYMKHMKLQLLNSQQDEDESSIESDEFDMSDSTRMSAVNSDLSSNLEERMQSPQNLQGQQDGSNPFASLRPQTAGKAGFEAY
ncbi:hypothetical protein DUI87_07634 [Hirundo rustica rustica]|uniref:Nucleolar protein 4 n=1 Tax=Hirundo rustica rustica TaxID=333673 RepID=A0A3M0KQQ7_HIRRU|nr:hypothetical protein DUI87_07634 [Hirundo rustica rustica]